MAGRQGFITNHLTYVYQNSPDNASAAFGIDTNDSDKWKLCVEPDDSAYLFPVSHFTIDPAANGDITLRPNGGGRIAVSYMGEGIVYTTTLGKLNVTAVGSAGEVLTSNGTGFAPTWGSAGATTWTYVTAAAHALLVNTSCIMNRGTLIEATLPATAARGSTLRLTGMGVGGYKIKQGVTQIIYFGTTATTPGAGGSLSTTGDRDGIELVCVVADTDWNVINSIGNWTVV